MRIALTHAFCWPEVRRGGERFTQELGAALTRRGHEVTLYSAAWDPAVATGDLVATVRLPRRFAASVRHERHFGLSVLPHLVRRRFDAVHSLGRHDTVASLRARWLRADGRRTVMTDLGFPDRRWWGEQGRWEARAAARAVLGVDVYSGMSRAAVAALEPNYGRSDGVVVPGGVRLASFRPAGEREPRPTILFSGAVDEPRKGVGLLLAALPRIAAAEPEVAVWLSGSGDPSPLLAGLDQEHRPRVHPLGLGEPLEQAGRYGRAWVTCLPSEHDSFGMALIESLACGTPILTTDHGAPQELVEPGRTGEVARHGDPQALAEAALRALRLARAPETVPACREAAARFDWDLALAPWCEQLYREGAGAAPRPSGGCAR